MSSAEETGKSRVDAAQMKVKREIEDQLFQFGLTVPKMTGVPWLSTQSAAYAEFGRSATEAKDGMTYAVQVEWSKRHKCMTLRSCATNN